MRFQPYALILAVHLALTNATADVSQPQPWNNLPLSRATVSHDGLTGDPCRDSSVCTADRHCIDINSISPSSSSPCSAASVTCLCLPRKASAGHCKGSATCARGERCIRVQPTATVAVCWSCATTTGWISTEYLDEGDCPPRSQPAGPPAAAGLTGDACPPDTAACAAPRVCTDVYALAAGALRECTVFAAACQCLPHSGDGSCDASADCPAGERCMRMGTGSTILQCYSCRAGALLKDADSLFIDDAECASEVSVSPAPEETADASAEPDDVAVAVAPTAAAAPAQADASDAPAPPSWTPMPTASPSPSPQPDAAAGVCIAAEALRHLPRAALVFRADRPAHVLCDGNGSCATPGHVVVHGGRAMTMRAYCAAAATCTARVAGVNSPRYSRGVRVASRTRGLAFTGLAARHETWAEELILHALVHAGW